MCDSGHSQSEFLNTFLKLTWHEAKSLLAQLFFTVGHWCQLLKGGVPGPGVHVVAPTDHPESTQNLCHRLDETASRPKALVSWSLGLPCSTEVDNPILVASCPPLPFLPNHLFLAGGTACALASSVRR